MSATSTTAALLLFLLPALAVGVRAGRIRRVAAAVAALAAAGFAVAAAAAAGSRRTLDIGRSFAAYVDTEVQAKRFHIEHVEAAGWGWAAVAACWCAGWGWVLWRRGGVGRAPLLGPVAAGLSAFALVLLMQKLAAPSAFALGLDLPGLPASTPAVLPTILAGAAALGATQRGTLRVLAMLSLAIGAIHLPIAGWSTFATLNQLGTSFDVYGIDFVANPVDRVPTELEPGSVRQLALLVWIDQLLVWPGLTMLSASGIAILCQMLAEHARAAGR